MQSVSRIIAACVSLAAFAVAVLAGLSSGNPAMHVLGRALMAMLLCYPVGLVIGLICDHVIQTHLRDYRQSNPMPDAHSTSRASSSEEDQEQEEILTV